MTPSRREFLRASALAAASLVACTRRARPTTPTAAPSTPDTPAPTAEPTDGTGAQPARWNRIEEKGPRARRDHTLTAIGSAVYLFGGRSAGRPLGDLWRHEDGSGWERIKAEGPPARFGHTAVAELGERLVVFGGQGAGDTFFNDVWLFDAQRRRWREIRPPGRPPAPRYGASAAPGGDGFIVSHGFAHGGRFHDTRKLRTSHDDFRWDDLTPGSPRPVKRCLHRAALDPGNGEMILFGGQTNGVPFLGDTWILGSDDGFETGRWREVRGPAPSARTLYALDRHESGIYLFGGNTAKGPAKDVWRFDGARWTRVEVDGSFGPGPRFGIEGAVLGAAGVMRIFGGTDGSKELDDLWQLILPV